MYGHKRLYLKKAKEEFGDELYETQRSSVDLVEVAEREIAAVDSDDVAGPVDPDKSTSSECVRALQSEAAEAAIATKLSQRATRETEGKWLDEAENMLHQEEKHMSTWLDDAERDINALPVEARQPNIRRRKKKEKGKEEKDSKTAEREVKEAEAALYSAEEEFGEGTFEVAQCMLSCAAAYSRARQWGLAQFSAKVAQKELIRLEGESGTSAIMAQIRLLHILAMQDEWAQVETQCATALRIIASAPKLTQAMEQLVDQLAVLTKVKCKLRLAQKSGKQTQTA